MASKTKLWTIALAAALLMVVVFWFGMTVGTRMGLDHIAIEVDNTQAILTFNRLLEGRRLEMLLSRGCVEAAKKKVDIRIDQDTKLLASLFKGTLSPRVAKYVNDRDPGFLQSLDKFTSKYGDSWKEPDCEQNGPLGKRSVK
jgi:hypothetical protein